MSVIGAIGGFDTSFTRFPDFPIVAISKNSFKREDWLIAVTGDYSAANETGFALYKKPIVFNLGSLLDIPLPGGYSINGVDRAGNYSNYRYKLFVYVGFGGVDWLYRGTSNFPSVMSDSDVYSTFGFYRSPSRDNWGNREGSLKTGFTYANGNLYNGYCVLFDDPSFFSAILPSDEAAGKSQEALDLFSSYLPLRQGTGADFGQLGEWLFNPLFLKYGDNPFSNPGFVLGYRSPKGELKIGARNLFAYNKSLLNVCPRPWTGFVCVGKGVWGMLDSGAEEAIYNTGSSISRSNSITFTYIGVEKVV